MDRRWDLARAGVDEMDGTEQRSQLRFSVPAAQVDTGALGRHK